MTAEPGPDGYLRFPVKMSRARVQVVVEIPSTDEVINPRQELSAGYTVSPSTDQLVVELIARFERLGYDDPGSTAEAIARTVRLRAVEDNDA